MSEIKLKLITAFKKSIDLFTIDDLDKFDISGNSIQIKVKNFYIGIHQERIRSNKDVIVNQYMISHGHLSEILSDNEFNEFYQLANEKYQKIKIEQQDSDKKIDEKELDDFLRLY